MARAIDKWALTVGSLLFVYAFAACKKKDEPAPAATVSASVAPVPAASAAVAEAAAAASAQAAALAAASASAAPAGSAAPALGEVKRFPDKEKAASGSTKVALEATKIYDAPDATTPPVATLSKDLVVTRLATLGSDWVLVEFPSGVGKVAPGWLEAKSLVAPGIVSTKPATSATVVASAKPAASAVASVTPAPSVSAPHARVKPGVMRAPSR